MTDPDAPLTRRAAKEQAARGAAKPAKRAKPSKQPPTAWADPAGEAPAAPRSGFAGIVAKHPRTLLGSALGLAFVLLGAGSVVAGVSTGGSASIAGPTAIIDETVARTAPETLPEATRLRTCTIKSIASDERLKTLHASIVNDETGEVLYERGGEKPARTASVLKIFTGAAAISVLGPEYQLTTTVYEGSAAGSVVLVGRGDSTLSRLTSGESVYKGAAKLSDLAAQVVTAYSAKYPEVPITQLIVDASYWNPKDNWDKSWARSDQTNGYQAEVTALQVDGDRADPTAQTSPRSDDPVGRASKAFAQAIATAAGTPAPAISSGTAASTITLGEVKSQPVSALVRMMLDKSDGAIAESLARVVSIEMGLDGSSSSLQQAIPSAIMALGAELPDVKIVDGSGLSKYNAVAPTDMANFLRIVRDSDDLKYVYDALSIAGETGGLKERFTNSPAKGKVKAKVGRISSAVTLAGVIKAKDGTVLTFAFFSIREGLPDTAKAAMDELTTAVYECGDNLANN